MAIEQSDDEGSEKVTSQQIGLLLVQLAVSLGIFCFIGIALIRASESTIKYKLFAVRDRLLFLAASGVFPPEQGISGVL